MAFRVHMSIIEKEIGGKMNIKIIPLNLKREDGTYFTAYELTYEQKYAGTKVLHFNSYETALQHKELIEKTMKKD